MNAEAEDAINALWQELDHAIRPDVVKLKKQHKAAKEWADAVEDELGMHVEAFEAFDKLATQEHKKLRDLELKVAGLEGQLKLQVEVNEGLEYRLVRLEQRLLEAEVKLQQAANEWFGVVKPPASSGPRFAPFTVTCNEPAA